MASEVILFEGEDLADKQMHYGGDVNIGPDGRIYLSTGDRLLGANAQSLTTTWGKMLRLNIDGSIPTEQPLLQPDHPQEPGHLGPRSAEPVQVHLPARDGPDVHR